MNEHDPNDARYLTLERPADGLGLVAHVNDRPAWFHGEVQPAGEVVCIAAALLSGGMARATFALHPHGQLHGAYPAADFSEWLGGG